MYGTCSVPLAFAEHVRLISVRSTSVVGGLRWLRVNGGELRQVYFDSEVP